MYGLQNRLTFFTFQYWGKFSSTHRGQSPHPNSTAEWGSEIIIIRAIAVLVAKIYCKPVLLSVT